MTEKRAKVKDYDQFQLRLSGGMRDALRAAAEDNGRSMNAEILARLDYTFDVRTLVRQSLHETAIDELKAATAEVSQQAAILKWMQEQQSVSMHLLEMIADTDGHLTPEFMKTLRGMLARRGTDTGFPEQPGEAGSD